MSRKARGPGARLVDLYPEKAQFDPAEPIGIVAEVEGPGAEVQITVTELLDVTDRLSARAGQSGPVRFLLPPRGAAFRGYGVEAVLVIGGKQVDRRWTAFDTADAGRRSLRYGFLADFDPGGAGDTSDVAFLNKLHLNAAQFYDWMYRHDTLLPPTDEFTDPMDRPKSLRAVRGKLAACRAHGILAIAYGAVYAATLGFAEQHPQWRLLHGDGSFMTFIDRFGIMSIAPDSPWSEHIAGQFRQAVEKLGFDGIHLDTYGHPKTAVSRVSGKDRLERLDLLLPALIRRVRTELAPVRPDACLIFNNVSHWPTETTAPAPVDAVYVEVWPPFDRYSHIGQIVREARRFGGGKPVIIAAYLAPFARGRAGKRRPDASALQAFRLLWAVISAHGASHLVLGGRAGILTRAYYPDYSRLAAGDLEAVRAYADFVARYAPLLFDPELRVVTMTHAGGDSREYRFSGCAAGLDGEPGRVWCVIRESDSWKTVHFINLSGLTDDRWNRGQPEPRPARDLDVSLEVFQEAASVLVASPDADGGTPRALPFTVERGGPGLRLRVRVPEVRTWSMLAVRLGKAPGAG